MHWSVPENLAEFVYVLVAVFFIGIGVGGLTILFAILPWQ